MNRPKPLPDRREFLTDAAIRGSGLLLAGAPALIAQAPVSLPGSELIRTIHFGGRRRHLGRVLGKGWQGRYFLDLAKLDADSLITPNDEFYIRTRCPEGIGDTKDWRIALRKEGRAFGEVSAKSLTKRSKSMGVHCLECSGNGGAFGLLSAAEWSGVPLVPLLNESGLKGDYIHVDGCDDHPNLPKMLLQQGCSWIFKRADLAKAGAFLATGMNGKPLPRDHGFPVRLFVPGWYGCCAVKWVQSIEVVGKDAPATKHMREYASRTHQKGMPKLARDYRPGAMDTAAMPIRVEEWRDGERTVFKIIGLLWGGERTIRRLDLHIGDADPVAVSGLDHKTHRTWSLWSHEWTPPRRGRFSMWLTVPDKTVRTRRLDRRYYKRRIVI